MPSTLGFNKPTSRFRSQELSNLNTQIQVVRGAAPWAGYTPDIDSAHLGISAAKSMSGLVPRTEASGRGEVLGNFPGYTHIDSTYGSSTNTGPLRLGDATGSQEDIVCLAFFARTNASGAVAGEYDDTTIAITAGDGSTAASAQMWRIVPSTGVWEEIVEEGASSSVAMIGSYPSSTDGVQLFDFAVFPASATPRTSLTALTAGEPIIVFTNNFDNVKVYAVDPAGGATSDNGTYEDLTEAFGAGANGFKARSVEAWGDRLNFLNTVENGVRYRNRLRRTAIGNGDPDASNDGSGAIDFEDFQGEGLRVEGLGSVLAVYFEDGIAFVRRTGQSASPYTTQIITRERGLLSTHSLCNLGGGLHFGLFTDGWFFLNENGQFQEAGVAQIDGIATPKWHRTFYDRINIEERARIDCVYDSKNKWIHITLPLDTQVWNTDAWIYDIQGDRVFPDEREVTKYGTSNIQLSSARTFAEVTDSFEDAGGVFSDYNASYGVESVIHGTRNGMVMRHDNGLSNVINLSTGDPKSPKWSYETQLSSFGTPRTMKTVREVSVELIPLHTGQFSGTLSGNAGEPSQSRTFHPKLSQIGDAVSITRGYRFTSQQASLALSGFGGAAIRSFDMDVMETGSRKRDPSA